MLLGPVVWRKTNTGGSNTPDEDCSGTGGGTHSTRVRRKESEIELAKDVKDNSSPLRTSLTSFKSISKTQVGKGKTSTRPARQTVLRPKRPTRIEEVPFRRQDRRTLNARYRRSMDRKLIICIVSSGLLLLGIGVALIVLHSRLKEDYRDIRPFIVIGPVLIGGGFMTIVFSVEVCFRLYRANQRVRDPELDNLINPHEVKHWMDPRIIPYGWGLFSEDEEIIVIPESKEGCEEPPVAVTGLLVNPADLVGIIDLDEDVKQNDDVSNNNPERIRTQIYVTQTEKPVYA